MSGRDEARKAAREGRWSAAVAWLDANGSSGFDGADFDDFAWALFFGGAPERSADLRQQAFAAYVAEGDPVRAGLAALFTASSHFGRGTPMVGAGWLEQAEKRLGHQRDVEAYAWLVWTRAILAAETGATATETAAAADGIIEEARRLASPDVEALGSLLKAQVFIRVGEVEAGAALLDEVMALAVGGCLGPFATSWIYCGTVSTCTAMGDLDRAWAWTSEVGRCSVQPGLQDFPGDCRLHRAELLRLRGRWTEAEGELARVRDLVGTWHLGHAGIAHTELGQVALAKGDFELAAAEFEQARAIGHSPQPGLASLRLVSGEPERADAELRDSLHSTDDPYLRIQLLAVAVEVSLALDDLPRAAAHAEDLSSLARVHVARPHEARAAYCQGVVLTATGDLIEAREQLLRSIALWTTLTNPYEAARARVRLSAVESSLGDAGACSLQLEDALATFERLGAVDDAQRASALLGRPPRTARVNRALMFTDIEASTEMLARLGDDAWLDVLRWHDAALRRLFVRHRGQEIHQKGGGDGFFVVFPTRETALDCALDIQSLLRQESAAMAVRIGVHWAEVSHADGDYSGRGVHEAARIAALANGAEIVASRATVTDTRKPYRTTDDRRVELRGLPEPISIVTVLDAQ